MGIVWVLFLRYPYASAQQVSLKEGRKEQLVSDLLHVDLMIKTVIANGAG